MQRSHHVRALAAALGAATVLSSPDAQANGRFPESNQIVFSETDPDLVILRATFGLLVSHDRGRTFDWVCEQSIGYSGVEDPMYTVTPASAFVATTFQGVSVTQDQGCSWGFVGGDLANQVFIDLSSRPKSRKDIVVFASSYDKQDDEGNILFTSRLWETNDGAATFHPLGEDLDPTFLGYTVDVTESDPDRLYITASRNAGTKPKAFLLTSKDHGVTWSEQEVPLEGTERSVFIAAVDPHDAERVYLRTAQSSPDRATRLLLREAVDGGPATLRVLFSAPDALLGFALTPDGSKVYIGSSQSGVQMASTTDHAFQQRSTQEVQCLAANDEGLWACSSEAAGFVAGFSKDDGATFEPRLHFCESLAIRGPLSCAAGSTTTDRCTALWRQQQAILGCDVGGATDGLGDGGADGGASANADPSTSLNGSGSGCAARGATGKRLRATGLGAALTASCGIAVAVLRRRRRRSG